MTDKKLSGNVWVPLSNFLFICTTTLFLTLFCHKHFSIVKKKKKHQILPHSLAIMIVHIFDAKQKEKDPRLMPIFLFSVIILLHRSNSFPCERYKPWKRRSEQKALHNGIHKQLFLLFNNKSHREKRHENEHNKVSFVSSISTCIIYENWKTRKSL